MAEKRLDGVSNKYYSKVSYEHVGYDQSDRQEDIFGESVDRKRAIELAEKLKAEKHATQSLLDRFKIEGGEPTCIIVPEEGTWKTKWDLLMLFLILYSTMVVPFRVCFPNADAQGFLYVFETFMSFCFLADVLFSFRLAYMEHGHSTLGGRTRERPGRFPLTHPAVRP